MSRISRLRMWFAVGVIVSIMAVAGFYFYARHKLQSGLKQVPEKIGLEFKQTAKGFSVSKSLQGHTLFKIEASKVAQLKLGERAELHDVQITLYGRDSQRFDQIRGDDFEYDQRSGDIVAKSAVEIDLEENPRGPTQADQAAPSGLKNSIHLTTTGLRFNQKTGNASTDDRVDFQLPQANGSAVGVNYVSSSGLMTLRSKVSVSFLGANRAQVRAEHGTISKEPRTVQLDHAVLRSAGHSGQADTVTLFLTVDNQVERLLAKGDVEVKSSGNRAIDTQAEQLEIFMATAPARDVIETALFSGNVHMEGAGDQPLHASADQARLKFSSKNLLTQVHTAGNVKLDQPQKPSNKSAAQTPAQNLNQDSAQNMELTAPVVDFFVAHGRLLQRAETSGAAQISIQPLDPKADPKGERAQTIITAGKFEAKFDSQGRLASAHGWPNARVVSSSAHEPDRISTSAEMNVAFHPGDGIESILQQGNFAYQDGERRAWADRARYTPADQVLQLNGSPRLIDRGMTTTAQAMKFNRSTGDALAEDDVKSTYSELKPQPGGALLASGDPIHVTAQRMAANRSPSIATYTGDARLWQNANVIQAPSIEFNRDRRSVDADGSAQQPVSTVLIQTSQAGQSIPIMITSAHFLYTDAERKAHYSGGVRAKGLDALITAREIDAFLQSRGAAQQSADSSSKSAATPPRAGKVERMIADGQVVMTQPERHGSGDHLVYTTADDKFVLTGGPPSIFDAEHGQVTGVSLTLFRHDDRVLIEGNEAFPAHSETKVAR